ncbi:MAG: prohibitin family protein [Oscillatoriaceae bacterium SKW80]|nr:prohibitin family protein [Oscillatoriaceae bacterium SKYG93]MCX8120157.1 prohibitin family protein [Oscillatoriaceae bacterium SKW80]MDW8453083.1 prohibitin family protein [Oscillatoriaceae cyanobacterium SKYGB_i_bin93]HIK29006.1 prohibitin family protein [Oscillatoriaceae cyanobacterium M7585_C2015_266]
MREDSNTSILIYIVGGFVLLVGVIIFKPFVIVNAGERGVVMQFGKVQETILDEGIHPILPIVTSVKTISVRVQKNDVKAEAASKDLQNVNMDVAVNWHIEPKRVNEVFQRVGDENEIINRIISPAVSEVVKAATAKKTAEEIITKRTELKQEIDNQLRDRLLSYGVILDDVSLVNVGFSPEFSKAIEAKQIAEQEAKRADFIALKAEKDAQAEINRAKGQAEAQRLRRQTLTSELLQQQAIEKWDGRFPIVMGGNGVLPFINIEANNLGGAENKR